MLSKSVFLAITRCTPMIRRVCWEALTCFCSVLPYSYLCDTVLSGDGTDGVCPVARVWTEASWPSISRLVTLALLYLMGALCESILRPGSAHLLESCGGTHRQLHRGRRVKGMLHERHQPTWSELEAFLFCCQTGLAGARVRVYFGNVRVSLDACKAPPQLVCEQCARRLRRTKVSSSLLIFHHTPVLPLWSARHGLITSLSC